MNSSSLNSVATKYLQKFCEMIPTKSIVEIFTRVLCLLGVIFLACFFACWWFCGNMNWIHDSSLDYSPLMGCPESVLVSHGAQIPQGPFCRVSIMFNVTLATSLADAALLGLSPGSVTIGGCSLSQLSYPEYIDCYWESECHIACKVDGTGDVCPDQSALADPRSVFDRIPVLRCLVFLGSLGYMQIPCFYVSAQSFCDSEFTVTPVQEIGIRGIISASLCIVAIWIAAEFILRSVEWSIKIEADTGRRNQQDTLPIKRAQLRAILEQRFRVEDRVTAQQQLTSRAWRRRIEQYRSLRDERKSSFKSTAITRSISLYLLYFLAMVLTLYMVLWVSPQNVSSSHSSNLWSVFLGQISFWKIHSALDVIVFLDILLDTGLFVMAAICVEWPRAPVFSRHLKKQMDHLLSKEMDIDEFCEEQTDSGILDISSQSSSSEDDDTESLSFVLRQSPVADCCLMIACHESTLTDEKAKNFAQTLHNALKIFPPSHVFVCDNGNAIAPVDDTQMVTFSVHPDINYLYIPEGNKTFAFYWCNRYWLPFLERAGVVPKFVYAMIIDDDVPLPADLHIPHEQLRLDSTIKAVHFPLTAVCPDGSGGNSLVKFQDLEYKLAAVHKQFQASLSRCLSCHGAVALWERKAMEQVFFAHDTVFHGEDMMMGLCSLKQRDDSKIISASQTLVPTYAPERFGILFRQRVKSWELTSHRKTLTYLAELLNPRSFCHIPSLVLKPYFLQELITISLDWLRIYLLCGLVFRDWAALLVMTSFFIALMYAQVAILTLFVLRSRHDLRPSLQTIACFPFYRLLGLLFRICALCQNLLVYSHNRTSLKIEKREDEIRDIPPVPPQSVVDWSSVWDPPTQVTSII